MVVFICAPGFRYLSSVFPDGSVARDVLEWFVQQQQGVSSQDFYVVRDGRRSDLDDPLQNGAVYHLQPRLCGGKGGFGSMLRALGAQIEKTTNREACRDLSGRRLRDVNHEKEMAEWLKKQAEREAEKEQRRLERLQRKLAEPKHQFADPNYQQQCHDLSERLEDSVLKGLQASSSSQVTAVDAAAAKRPNPDQSEQPEKKKKKKEAAAAAAAAACFWTGVDELLSSEEEEESPSTSSSAGGDAAVAVTTEAPEAEPGPSSRTESPSPPSASRTAGAVAEKEEGKLPTGEPSPESSRSPPPQPDDGDGDGGPQPGDGGPQPGDGPQDPGVPALCPSSASSAQQLESLGLEVLKRELMSRGLKCGGTLAERAARLFAVKDLKAEEVDPALLAKPGKAKKK